MKHGFQLVPYALTLLQKPPALACNLLPPHSSVYTPFPVLSLPHVSNISSHRSEDYNWKRLTPCSSRYLHVHCTKQSRCPLGSHYSLFLHGALIWDSSLCPSLTSTKPVEIWIFEASILLHLIQADQLQVTGGIRGRKSNKFHRIVFLRHVQH